MGATKKNFKVGKIPKDKAHMIHGKYILRLSRGDVEKIKVLSRCDAVERKFYHIVTKLYHIVTLKMIRF